MTEPTYRVVFAGKPLAGVERDTAVANLARLLKRTPEQVVATFNGKPTVIKRGLLEGDAMRYVQTLEKAGLQVSCQAEQAAGQVTENIAAPVAAAPPKPVSIAELSLVDPDAAPVNAPVASTPQPVVAAPKINPLLALVVDEDQQEEESTSSATHAAMTCPACGHEQPKAERCDACGVIIAKFVQRQAETKKQDKAAHAGLPETPKRADVPDSEEETAKPSLLSKLFGKLRGG